MKSQFNTHRNVSDATVAGMARLMSQGSSLRVRNQEIREVRNQVIVVSRPLERCLFVPGRNNNIFISLAETLWVLAGRNDIGWLQAYLPRAAEFSDDGLTWRAGYGPRLRNWSGVDQIKEVRALLLAEAATRRAAMSLYDPGRDFVESKDIPCNNWLHWLIRDGRLHLNVAMRSSDIVWGFSGINSFEWSVLHEIMAFWLGVEPGDVTYFASSFHIYDRHYSMAEKAVKNFTGTYCYDFNLVSPKFCTVWNDFDKSLKTWFELEAEIRKTPERPPQVSNYLTDPLLTTALDMARLHHGVATGWDSGRIRDELSKMQATDLTAAAYEFFSRSHPLVLDHISQPSIAAFFDAYLVGDKATSATRTPPQLFQAIKSLHREKDAAYGPAWKRRGELTSIMANIARKVDRLEQYNLSAAELRDETLFDTAVDLLVYLLKYMLFLQESMPIQESGHLPAGALKPYSDHISNFDWLVDHMASPSEVTGDSLQVSKAIVPAFEKLHELASNHNSSVAQRFDSVIKLREMAFTLVFNLYKVQPNVIDTLRKG